MKRTALLRRAPLRSRPRRIDYKDPGRVAWKIVHAGWCDCGCDRFALYLEHHHVIERSRIVQMGRPDLEWDPRNGMYITSHCHDNHTSAFRRIPLSSVSDAAVEFAVELFGSAVVAAQHLSRFYAPELREGEGRWKP